MLLLEDRRPFAVRMADKKLSGVDPMSYVKSLYSDMPALADSMYRYIYSWLAYDPMYRIDPIFPGIEIRFSPAFERIHWDINRSVEWGPELDLMAALQQRLLVDRK